MSSTSSIIANHSAAVCQFMAAQRLNVIFMIFISVKICIPLIFYT